MDSTKNIALGLLHQWKLNETPLDVVFNSPLIKLCDASGLITGFSGIPDQDAAILTLSSGAKMTLFIDQAEFNPNAPLPTDCPSETSSRYARSLGIKHGGESCWLLEQTADTDDAA